MKKLFAMILTLCLLCGAALATSVEDPKTTVIYNAAECTDYTVNIPATVNLTISEADTANATGSLEIGLDGSKVNVNGFKVDVTLDSSSNGFMLRYDGSNKVSYTVKKDSTAINAKDVVLTWTSDTASTVTGANVELSMSAKAEDFKVAGEYTDILTFKVSGAKTGTGGGDVNPGIDESEATL